MGTVSMSIEAFGLKMEQLMAAEDWHAGQYELLTHNCNTFCNMLCLDLLAGRGIPPWVNRLSRWGSGVSSALQILNFSQLVSPAPDPNTAQGTKERSAWASVSECGSSTPDEWDTRRVLPERRNEAGLLSPCGGSPEFRGEEDVCLQALTGGKLKRGPAWSEGAIRKAEAEEAEEAEWATPAMSPAAFPSPAAMADLKSPATPILQDMQHCQHHHIYQVERCSVNPPEVA